MAWQGMAWHGVVWYGMVWYGMAIGMAWHEMAWHGMIWRGGGCLPHIVPPLALLLTPRRPGTALAPAV